MTGRVEAAIVWQKARERLPLTKDVDLGIEVAHVLRHLETESPDLFSGSPVPRRSVEDIIQLARRMSSKVTELRVRVRFQFLAFGFEIGNRDHGWNVPLVPQLVRVRKARNWATVDNFTRRVVAGHMEVAFGKAIERPPENDLVNHLGQILFSAVFFGGVLEKCWFEPFLNAVVNRNYFQHKGIIWVEMAREIGLPAGQIAEPGESAYVKRFLPDNFTAVQLYRLLELGLVPTSLQCPKPWVLLQNYLKTLPGISDLQLPDSLDEFLELAVSRNLFLPGSMLSYATGKLKSTSLAIEPWLRCISGKAVSNSRPERRLERQKQNGDLKVVVPVKYSFKRQSALFGKMLKEIGPNSKGVELSGQKAKAVFVRMLADHKNELSPAFQLMIHWGIQLLNPRSSYLERRSKREAVTNRTVRRYFRAIGSEFLMVAENQDLTKIDQAELELLYEETIENRRSDAKAANCLYQFHGFLMAFYALPPIESIELKGGSSGATNANANLITLDLYHLVLRGLGLGKKNMSRWQLVQVIAWVIAYRCGLRPSEILNLRLVDFQVIGAEDFELLVRISPKTERSRRRFPASLCMNRDEIRLCLDYYQKRCQEIGLFGDNYLLAHPEQRTGRLTDEAIFESVRILLRAVTKDDTLRLYHARHTFNSCLQVQFQLRGEPLFNQAGFLNLNISTRNDQVLRNALMANESWGRKDQHIQGILVGHSSPIITNQYYNHLSDVLLGTLVRQRRDAVPVSLAAVAKLGGLQQSWAGELLTMSNSDHPLAGLVKALAKRYAAELTHPLLAQASSMSLPAVKVPEEIKLPPWDEVLDKEVAQELRRGEYNWDIACQIYERVRHMKGKRFRSVAFIIQEMNRQHENSSKRWRGPIYKSITELRAVLAILMEIGVSTESVVLVHHPRRGQPKVEQTSALQLWKERTDMPTGGWVPGEPANATATKKGIIELRVVDPEANPKAGNLPPVSRGFEISIRLLAKALLPKTT